VQLGLLVRRQRYTAVAGSAPTDHEIAEALPLCRGEKRVGPEMLNDNKGAAFLRAQLGGEGVKGLAGGSAKRLQPAGDGPERCRLERRRIRHNGDCGHGSALASLLLYREYEDSRNRPRRSGKPTGE